MIKILHPLSIIYHGAETELHGANDMPQKNAYNAFIFTSFSMYLLISPSLVLPSVWHHSHLLPQYLIHHLVNAPVNPHLLPGEHFLVPKVTQLHKFHKVQLFS